MLGLKRRGLVGLFMQVLVLVHGFLVSILLLNTGYFSYNDDSQKTQHCFRVRMRRAYKCPN